MIAVLALLTATLEIESSPEAPWLNARCDVTRENDALVVAYDFRDEITSSWFRRDYEAGIDLRPYGFLRFTLTGDGSGTRMLTHLIRFEDGKERAYRSEAFELDFEGERVFSVELRFMREEALTTISESALATIRQVNFALSKTADTASAVTVSNMAFVTEPEGTVIRPAISNARFVSDEDFVDAVTWPAGVDPSVMGFGEHLADRSAPRYFFDGRQANGLIRVLHEHYAGYAEAKQRHADEYVLKRRFRFEGDERQLSTPMPWLQGPVEWTNILNRLQYLESLYVSYWHTGDEVYAQDCVAILVDWIDHNPVPEFCTNDKGREGNPWRSLEAGIRCDTMTRTFFALLGSPSFTPAQRAKVARSLAEHARYLNVFQDSGGYRPGNFQVVEATGLAMVGMLFPEFEEAGEWVSTGLHWLYAHMERDVYDDGTHWEVTPGYHGWVAERFTTAWRLAQLNGIAIRPEFTQKLEAMYVFDLKIVSPTGHCPMNGDCGRYGLTGRLARGALLFEDSALRFRAVDAPPLDLFWLFGEEVFARYAALPKKEPDFTTVLLPDSGYGIMRSGWGPDDTWFFFDLAPYGGGHSHPDQLSFELQVGPVLLVGDSGRVNYNHPLHYGYMRTAPAHNVCSIDGRFADVKDSPERLEWQVDEHYVVARGRVPIGDCTWERGIVWLKPNKVIDRDVFVVCDVFVGQGEHTVERYFNHVPAYSGNVPEAERREALGLPMDPGECITLFGGDVRREPGHFGINASTQYDTETTIEKMTVSFPAVFPCVISTGPFERIRIREADIEEGLLGIDLSAPETEASFHLNWTWPKGTGVSRVSWGSAG